VRPSAQCSRQHPFALESERWRCDGEFLPAFYQQQRETWLARGRKDTHVRQTNAGKIPTLFCVESSCTPNPQRLRRRTSFTPNTQYDAACVKLPQEWADQLGPTNCNTNPQIGCTGRATIASIVAHIEHIKSIAGVESVGFGADFDGIGVVPSDASSVAAYPAVITVSLHPHLKQHFHLDFFLFRLGSARAWLEQQRHTCDYQQEHPASLSSGGCQSWLRYRP
jgi:hypothetical protein